MAYLAWTPHRRSPLLSSKVHHNGAPPPGMVRGLVKRHMPQGAHALRAAALQVAMLCCRARLHKRRGYAYCRQSTSTKDCAALLL